MKNYWLWTDDEPYEDWEDYGIFEFETFSENNSDVTSGKATKILFCTQKTIEPGFSEEMWEDSESNDPRRIIKFLFGKEY